MDIPPILKSYDLKNLTIAVLGSHSALDICSGAKKEGLPTLVITQKRRNKTYDKYYRSQDGLGCVDETLILDDFKDILAENVQEKLHQKNAIFIPHRSFEVYLNSDYEAIENRFSVPMFGNRCLLKVEERSARPNQYDLLHAAGIRTPRIFSSPDEIDRPVLVKVLEKERGFERAFFIVSSPEKYREKSEQLIENGAITREALQQSVIEEFILGVQVNLNYFYSPLLKRLEFMGSDTRRQTNLEGFLRLPENIQKEVGENIKISYEEAGHSAVTILESLLEQVYEIGEKFVAATQKLYPPGIIGPFALQSFILPGPPKKEFVVFDVSPRMPGSPGIQYTPYTKYLFGKNISMGERIAMEIKKAAQEKRLGEIVT